MVKEFSAGGIVFKKRKAKSVKRKIENILWLVCQHSQHKGWGFPKGLIGDTDQNEKKEVAALREVKEEGGVEVKRCMGIETRMVVWRERARRIGVEGTLPVPFTTSALGGSDES